MATPLRRLMPYHHRYRQPFWIGMFALVVARVFEAAIPLFLRDGIDAMVVPPFPIHLASGYKIKTDHRGSPN